LRRCGVASAPGAGGTRAVALVTVEALADLAPLPVRGRTGQWITVEAHLRASLSDAAVYVVAPGGAPRRVPSWLDGRSVRARFALDRPGEFGVQVVATTPSGPRPVAEAAIFADVEPAPAAAAPGEDAAEGRP